MKTIEKSEARRLRKENGMSILEISQKLNVSKGSVSLWVRDIELNDEQLAVLLSKNPAFNSQSLGGKASKECALEKRKQFQEEGRAMVRKGDIDFISGCMLYWAEGSKAKNTVEFSNSDVEMIKIFTKFLKKCFDVKNEEIKVRITCYVDNGIKCEDVENYWVKEIGVEKTNLNKTIVNHVPVSSKQYKKNRLLYGVCVLRINRTDIAQKIYGAIQEIGGFNRESWLW